MAKGKKKKSSRKYTPIEKVLLATAILNLIKALIDLIIKLIE